MKVSIITPTFCREQFHSRILQCVSWQTHTQIEWLVLDDSPYPSELLRRTNKANILYTHTKDRMTLGDKRNWLIERCSGDVIAHFDDDDFYSPNFISSMLSFLNIHRLDFLNLRGWFVYDKRIEFFGYWNLLQKTGIHYACEGDGLRLMNVDQENYFENNEIGWGFSFLYRKKVWKETKFQSQNWNEDGIFSAEAHKKFIAGGFLDEKGICLHEIHGGNNSKCFPQYSISPLLINKIFPNYIC